MPTNKQQSQIIRDEHDETLLTKRTSLVSAPTLYVMADLTVGDTIAISSNVTVEQGNSPWGSLSTVNNWPSSQTVDWLSGATVAISSSATLNAVVNTAVAGQASVVLDTGISWIGLATVAVGSSATLNAVVNTAAAGQASVVLDTGTNYIGLATVDIGASPTLTVDATGQGDVPVTLDSEAVVLGAGTAGIGFATVSNPNLEYSYDYIAAAGVNEVTKAAPGFLHAILVGDAVASSVIEVSNHASDGDGTVVIYLAGDTLGPALYPVNMKMSVGITSDITNQTHVTMIYR